MAIESDSVQPVPRLRQKLFQMMALAADKLRNLGAGVESIDLGSQQVPGVSFQLGKLHIYNHHPDVVSREALTQTLTAIPTESRLPIRMKCSI